MRLKIKYPWSHVVVALLLHPIAVLLLGGSMFYIGREVHTMEQGRFGKSWWRHRQAWRNLDWKGLWPVPVCVALQVALLVALLASPAAGQELHDAGDPAHWYDNDCCNLQDCAPVAVGVVRGRGDGWMVRVPAKGHPKATKDLTRLIPFDHSAARVSQDGRDHVCALAGRILCVYVAPRAF